jgi:hypothetical protein
LRLPPLLLAQWRSGQPDALDPHSTQASEVGCDGAGMHWTPIDGATLLHLAFDFHETEVAAWLLAHGADANARASVDAERASAVTRRCSTPWSAGRGITRSRRGCCWTTGPRRTRALLV